MAAADQAPLIRASHDAAATMALSEDQLAA
jgi:hypothetical protein